MHVADSTAQRAKQSYFAVGFDLVIVQQPLTYDLYVNSSALADRERFVRIFPKGGVLSNLDLHRFKEKYVQIYVPESQRGDYLKSICSMAGKTEKEKTLVLKDSAIQHLGKLFANRTVSTEVLGETLSGCRDVVEGFVGVIQDYNIEKVQELIGSLSFHDFYTYDHSINVSMYSIFLYRLLHPEANEQDLVNAGMGGLLHDIGKIRIPVEILNSTGKLTDEEFMEIKKHPGYGFDLLEDSRIQVFKQVDLDLVRKVVYQHHENFDGTGYPQKLTGREIHEMARVTTIADFFDALTTKRSYQDMMTTKEALVLMNKTRGKKIDPRLFDLFVKHTGNSLPEHLVRNDAKIELSEDFDPCQPQDHVKYNFGKVIQKK